MDMYNYLQSRRLNPYTYQGMTVDHFSQTVTFPLWNLSGEMVGFQAHKPLAQGFQRGDPSDARYHTIIPTKSKRVTAFGVELLDPKQEVLFIAEGIFDVAPLHARKVNALAVLCNNPKHLHRWLRSLGYTVVALVEGDRAGQRIAKLAHKAEFLPEGKDPADMPDSWFDELVEKYTGVEQSHLKTQRAQRHCTKGIIMSTTLKHAYATLTENSAVAFEYIKNTYGSSIHIGTHKDKPLQLIGTKGAFQCLLMYAKAEANNAVGDVEYMAYSELVRKLQGALDVYQA